MIYTVEQFGDGFVALMPKPRSGTGLERLEGGQLRVIAPPGDAPGAVPVELVVEGEVVSTCEATFAYR